MIDIDEVKNHINNRPYMGGLTRDKARIKATGEIFTPTDLVDQILDKLPLDIFTDKTKTVIDPSMGDGQFICQILIRRLENGMNFDDAISGIYGIDIMESNVELAKERILCNQSHLKHIVDKNLICSDALSYHMKFGDTPTDVWKSLFA